MEPLTSEEFERIVEEAIAAVPKRFREAMENIVIVIEDEPTDDDFETADSPESYGGSFCDDELLGLYDGISLPDRVDFYELDVPDVITVYKGPHERCFEDRDELVEEVGKTIVHEIGHYFGLDDDKLYDMGY
ncbi:metallopeptidase family protein [Xiamenia xianingshaonis]|uniref:Metallopeptidase family protein n=1 Tax=Xiamenia xianingshaonis TaxID=2682776 RepID=A0A9E6MSM3_9ACTN|nr:metallopeptidase family protein [Xiamenia xianingshaonis]NGM18153.1 Zn-dependent protease [Eggerthellaceae bacterium zg-893]NHM14472.1 Zn-dependent protease [Xiamenia xianingshaonis]QTU84946.1 metallopeptidase family protein [Xiamenia xianingshaonis]